MGRARASGDPHAAHAGDGLEGGDGPARTQASHDANARGPWLTTAASGSCRLKSAAAIDAEDVPVAHHANESSRLSSARVC